MSDVELKIPTHLAIIMDGNGRWAQRRGLPRSAGHLAGAKNLVRVVDLAMKAGIKILTVYAFSTENWKRPADEVDYLMRLIPHFAGALRKRLMERNVRLRAMGRLKDLPDFAQKTIRNVEELTRNNDGFTLNVALSYGGRAEILDGIQRLLADRAGSENPAAPLTEQEFRQYLYAPDLPDPDLVVRTSGELRLSNFMLWQLSYSELYVTETHWPDFDQETLRQALEAYSHRQRRFGKVPTPKAP
jgi:undecaprenyl diphosphate synthase